MLNYQQTMTCFNSSIVDGKTIEERIRAAKLRKARLLSKWKFRWLCCLILSFCYELPLIKISSMDRANPRLFDFVAFIGIVFLLPRIRRNNIGANEIYKSWEKLIIWFFLCSLVWTFFFLPWSEAGQFSIYYAFKYLEGLLVIYIVASLKVNHNQKKILHYCVVLGGIFVAIYAVPEYLAGGTSRAITDGKIINYAQGSLFSSLGPTYFHVSTFSVISLSMTLALIDNYKSTYKKLFVFFLSIFVGWPAVFSGARSGLILTIIVLLLFLIRNNRIKLYVLCTVVMLLVVFPLFGYKTDRAFDLEYLSTKSRTIERFTEKFDLSAGQNEFSNTIGDRVYVSYNSIQGYTLDLYSYQGWLLPLLGGGFYVVPHTVGSRFYYRKGYGIHNCYLFPFEQAGILGFILFVIFIKKVLIVFRRGNKLLLYSDKRFLNGMVPICLALLIVGWVGQVFWLGFGTENMNTYIIVLIILSIKQSIRLDGFIKT